MTHDQQPQSSPDAASNVIDSIRKALDSTNDVEQVLILSARLAAFGIEQPYRDWPSSISAEQARDLPSLLQARCLHVIQDLNEIGSQSSGRSGDSSLDSTLEQAQDLHCLHVIDRRHGALLAPAHPAFEGLSHVCSRVLLDDDAAAGLEEASARRRCDLMDPRCVLPVMLHPLGDSARLAVALDNASRPAIPVVEVTPLPVFEGELVFDGGRPSQRMMRRFAERCGLIRCLDGSECDVRAVLEEDWRISIEFNGPEAWCRRIDRVRLGSRTTLPDDDRRDFWSTSLQALGLDAQTRLVGQPILVALTNGERFSL